MVLAASLAGADLGTLPAAQERYEGCAAAARARCSSPPSRRPTCSTCPTGRPPTPATRGSRPTRACCATSAGSTSSTRPPRGRTTARAGPGCSRNAGRRAGAGLAPEVLGGLAGDAPLRLGHLGDPHAHRLHRRVDRLPPGPGHLSITARFWSSVRPSIMKIWANGMVVLLRQQRGRLGRGIGACARHRQRGILDHVLLPADELAPAEFGAGSARRDAVLLLGTLWRTAGTSRTRRRSPASARRGRCAPDGP